MPQVHLPSLSTMCKARSSAMPSSNPTGVGGGFLALLLGVLCSTMGCHANGSHALGTIGDPWKSPSTLESGVLKSGVVFKEVLRPFDHHANPSVRPTENPPTAEAITAREDESAVPPIASVAAHPSSTLIILGEVQPSSKPTETPAARLVVTVGATDVGEDLDEEESTHEEVVKLDDSELDDSGPTATPAADEPETLF